MVMPFDGYYARGRSIDGLIGYDLFARFIVAIDFRHHTLTVWEPSTFKPRGAAVSVPVEFAGRLPTVPALLEFAAGRSLPARLMVDTGASQSVILRYPYATEHDLLEPSAPSTSANSLASGPRKLLDVPVEQIRLGGWTFDRPAVQAYAEPIGSGAGVDSDGLIGNGLLSRFILDVDYPHRRLLFGNDGWAIMLFQASNVPEDGIRETVPNICWFRPTCCREHRQLPLRLPRGVRTTGPRLPANTRFRRR